MTRLISCLLLVIACLLVVSCSHDTQSVENSNPSFSNEIKDTPESPTTDPVKEPEPEPEEIIKEEVIEEEVWVEEEWYEEPVYYSDYQYQSQSTATDLTDLLNGQGRAIGDDGTNYTWYYHDLGAGALDIPGETFDADGVSHDKDGYIVVAADGYDYGDVIGTPYGEAKVYDSGSGYGTVDIYTNR